MPSIFFTNIAKVIAVSAVAAVVLSLAGKQAGNITYMILNPSEDLPVAQYTDSRRKAVAPPLPAPLSSNIVKKAVPVHDAKRSGATVPQKKPRSGTGKEPEKPANRIEIDHSGPVARRTWSIQTGVFTNKANAARNAGRFSTYLPATIILTCPDGGKIYAVRFGAFSDKAVAEKALAGFQKKEKTDAIPALLYGKQDLIRLCSDSP